MIQCVKLICCRAQASDNICQAGCNPAVMSFLGIKQGSQKTPGEISKLERHPNGHVKKNPVTDDSLPMMSVGLSENTCTSFSKGHQSIIGPYQQWRLGRIHKQQWCKYWGHMS